MKVNCLGADTPLSKTYEEIAPGNYKETSYPHVARFTSIDKQIDDLATFYATTIAAANEGLCLLKGRLDRPLIDESRAGHTNSTEPTEWLCLDVDLEITDVNPVEFLERLDPVFKDVSFVFQYSAGQDIKTHQGWRGHYFILLEFPQSPQALKQWLIARNLSIPMLDANIRLSASGGALIYPLDVTTCQNDKLIYIAPPTCKNFDDPVTERFLLFERSAERAALRATASAAQNGVLQASRIKQLRDAAGLKPKDFKLVQHQGWDIITNPDPVTVTGKKEARDFVYLNLNSGDSWGYYFPVTNPDILYNFKGEPCMYMWDVDKKIYNEYLLACYGPTMITIIEVLRTQKRKNSFGSNPSDQKQSCVISTYNTECNSPPAGPSTNGTSSLTPAPIATPTSPLSASTPTSAANTSLMHSLRNLASRLRSIELSLVFASKTKSKNTSSTG